jgi:hypothetical protein
MFEDMEGAPLDETSDPRDASDRELLHGIWARREIGDLPADQAWAELHRRYPQEPRFLLLNAFEELSQPSIPGVYTFDYFVAKASRLAEEAAMRPWVADLVALFEAHPDPGRTAAEASALAETRRRVTPPGYSKRGASSRLSRLADTVLRQYHDRSLGNQPLFPGGGAVATPPASAAAPPSPERQYRRDAAYAIGERVHHPSFGVGVVESVVEGKVSIRFAAGMKTLACGRS